MARQFGNYSPPWPLGTDILEVFVFEDSDGNPVDLTGADARMQIRDEVPERDPDTGQALIAPLLELTTDLGLYPVGFDAWPVVEALRIGEDADTPDPTDGHIVLELSAVDTWQLSDTNERRKLVYDIELLMADGTVIPLLSGKVTLLTRVTLELPT